MNRVGVGVGDRVGGIYYRPRPEPERVFHFLPRTRSEPRNFGGTPTRTGRGRVGAGRVEIAIPSNKLCRVKLTVI